MHTQLQSGEMISNAKLYALFYPLRNFTKDVYRHKYFKLFHKVQLHDQLNTTYFFI